MDLLKENYIFGLSFAPSKYVFWRIVRSTVIPLNYNLLDNGAISGVIEPYNTNWTAYGYSSYFQTITSFPIPQSKINTNVTDLFKIDNDNEIWQVFIGISPSYLKVIPVQPSASAPIFHLDQSINPLKTYIDFGFDGFDSPFDEPSNISETFIMAGLNLGLVIENPVSIPLNPSFKFIINRMIVTPIQDPSTAKAIIEGRIPAHLVSIGSPENNLSQSVRWSYYPKAIMFTINEETGVLTKSNANGGGV